MKKISNIPISHRLPEDRLYWDLETDGVYLVWSAYRALIGDVCTFTEDATSFATNWWMLHHLLLSGGRWGVPKFIHRVKLFAWRACLGVLHTRVGLNRRMPAIVAT